MFKKLRPVILIFIFFLMSGCLQTNQTHVKGHLIIIGGGKRPVSVMKKFVELAGGENARIAIIPMASQFFKEVGPRYEEEFARLGAAKAKAFFIQNPEAANQDSLISSLTAYTGVFFSGGNQNTLTKIFGETRFLSYLKEAYANGLTIGGTSAGAAIMSRTMITGDGNWNVLMKDSVKTAPGFGFLENVVIDQHFFKRRRFNRLLNISMQHSVTGIGIDESTALWVKNGSTAEVLGESVVIVIHPDNIKPDPSSPLLTGKELMLDIYKEGDVFLLNR